MLETSATGKTVLGHLTIDNNYSRPLVLLVTLDVKNTFHSMKGDVILDALENIYVTGTWSVLIFIEPTQF